jgi:NTP pyrophosphatase (non-canonical NTP hydrolase)
METRRKQARRRPIGFDVIKHIEEIIQEVDRAGSLYPPYHSEHEGYAVLLEEVDELWDAIKVNHKDPNRKEMIKEEAIQVAATAIRFLNSLCD